MCKLKCGVGFKRCQSLALRLCRICSSISAINVCGSVAEGLQKAPPSISSSVSDFAISENVLLPSLVLGATLETTKLSNTDSQTLPQTVVASGYALVMVEEIAKHFKRHLQM